MKILLDNHCWLWWLFEPEKLSNVVIDIISSSESQLYLSVASIWEIGIKFKLGKLNLPLSPEVLIPQQMEIDNIFPLFISVDHAITASTLPLYHKDPFDRMLIGQSQLESMSIITNDSIFSSYDVDTLW